MFKRKIMAAVILLSIALTFTACANNAQTEAETFATITDHAGREVTLAEKPEKIVSGYYITSSIVIALGADDMMVGIENKADTRPIYALSAPELLELPGVGTAKDFDVEGTAALEPDLVILPLKLQETADVLSELGIPAICVNPENDELLGETIDMIATATGTEDRAEEIHSYVDGKLAELGEILADTTAPTVYLGGNSELISTAGAAMYQNTLMANANAKNVAEEITDTYWASISYEQLIAYNPDYIIIAPAAKYTAEDVLNDSALAELEAVKNGRVFAMPSTLEAWDSPLPASYLGSLWITAIIHGDVYDMDSFAQETTAFYANFYDFDVDVEGLLA